MMLPPKSRAPTDRAILRRDRELIESRLTPTNGTAVKIIESGRADHARFEIDKFRESMYKRRGRYSADWSGS